METVRSHAGRLFVRFVMTFFRIEHSHCGDQSCRCKDHQALGVRPLGWYALLAFMLAMALFTFAHR